MNLVSMTGFGQAASESSLCRVAVSLRTVNHKRLDLMIRLPDGYLSHEAELRELVASRMNRGRVEIRFDIEDFREQETRIELNRTLIDQLIEALRQSRSNGLISESLTASDLVRIPDAIRVRSTPLEADASILSQISSVLIAALEEADLARRAEGERLGERLIELLGRMAEIVEEVEARQEEVIGQLTQRFEDRLGQLLGGDVQLDRDRVAQEVAVLVDRADVREELDRLGIHIEHFREVLAEGGPIGRRLDFLAQEMFRELTTLAAKCRHTSVIQFAIDAKLVCEQIREQVQNLE